MTANSGDNLTTSSLDGYIDCEHMRRALLDSYGHSIAGISGDLQIRAAIVQALRETKVASRILDDYLKGGPSPDEKFFPSQVNVKLQPAHHEVDRVLDERLKRFLGSIPTVEVCDDAPNEGQFWVVSRPALGAEGPASVDTVIIRDVLNDYIDGEPRQIAHYGIEHHFSLPEETN